MGTTTQLATIRDPDGCAPILSLAEVGTTVSADHLLQMATMPLEGAFPIRSQSPISLKELKSYCAAYTHSLVFW